MTLFIKSLGPLRQYENILQPSEETNKEKMQKIANLKRNKPFVCDTHQLKLIPCIYPTQTGCVIPLSPPSPCVTHMCPVCFEEFTNQLLSGKWR